jgi:hypothetical protein
VLNDQQRVAPRQWLTLAGAFVAALLVLLGLAALDVAQPTTAQAQASASGAKVRAVHAIPNVGPVDVFVNGTRTLTNVNYFSVSPYLPLPAGSYTVNVAPAGQPLSAAVLTNTFAITDGASYSIVASGSTSTTTTPIPSQGISLTALLDDNSQPALNSARIRVAHLSPNAPPVTVQINGTTVITNLAFRDAEYLEVPAGVVTAAVGLLQGGNFVSLLAQPVRALRGEVATYYAVGFAPGTQNISATQALTVAVSGDEAFSRLRAVHAIPDAPPVDVYVNGEKVVDAIAYFGTSRYYGPFPSGSYTVEVRAAGAAPTSTALLSSVVQLPSDIPRDLSVAAIGTLTTTDSISAALEVYRDSVAPPAAGQGRVSVVHAAPGAPAVDVLLNGTRVITNLAFSDVSNYLPAPPGTYTVAVAPAGGAPIFTTTATVEAGQSITFWASGQLTATRSAQRFAVNSTVDNQAQVRVLHAIPGAPPVDVYVNGARAVNGLVFGDVTEYLPLLEDSYAISVTASGSTTPIITESVALIGSADYTVAAVNPGPVGLARQASGPGLQLIFDENYLPALGFNARVRFVHLAADVPTPSDTAVDVRTPAGVLFDDVTYGGVTPYVQVPAGSVPISVTNGAGTATALTTTLDLVPGTVNSVFAIGGGNASIRLVDRLFVIDRQSPYVNNQRFNIVGRQFGAQ